MFTCDNDQQEPIDYLVANYVVCLVLNEQEVKSARS